MQLDTFWMVWTVFVVLVLVFIAFKIASSHKRRCRLTKNGSTIDFEEVLARCSQDGCVVVTDLGYGSEAWFIPSGIPEFNLSRRVYENGRMIFPNPKIKTLQQRCNQRSIRVEFFAHK